MNEAATQAQLEKLIEFDADTHTYYVNGEEQLHVTRVLSANGLIDDDWFTEYGRWRGSASHKACELLDKGTLDNKTVDPEIRPYLAAWWKFKAATKFKPMFIEHRVFDPIYGFCGTFDRAGYFDVPDPDGNQVLIDIKTGQLDVNVTDLQLAAYGRGFQPGTVFRRLAVRLKNDETYAVTEFPIVEYLDDCNDFLAAVRMARRKQRHPK